MGLAERVLSLAQESELPRHRALDSGHLRAFRFWDRVANALWRFHHWLDLPWRCRLIGHTPPVVREHYNLDAMMVEERWAECGRCGHYFGHSFP